jgi:hypothetical protein
VITAGALIVLFAARGLTRIIYLAGLVAIIAAQQVATHFIVKPDDFARLDPLNKTFAWVFLAWIVAWAGVQLVSSGRAASEAGTFTKAMAYVAILVWVMTAAAGRWLAFA